MSNNQPLTWDNMEEVISSLPKDENGRFLPNLKAKEPILNLSTERDKWPEISATFGIMSEQAIASVDDGESFYPFDPLKDNRNNVEIESNQRLPSISTDPELLEKAKANLETLDTVEAEKEFEVQALNAKRTKDIRDNGLDKVINSPLNNPNMTPEQLKEWSEANIDKAKGIVATMDAHLESGGRVNVADKYLMNCKADLNQLIPFKYVWSWSLYLTSCEHHWMPAEMSLDRCVKQYLSLGMSNKKLIGRAYLSHLSRNNLFPESVLLNLYRMVSNPECRQYLLRQAMESVTVKHAWLEINEVLGVKDHLLDGQSISKSLNIDDTAFRNRHRITMQNAKFMHDYTSETNTTKKLADFVKAFIVLYTHTNWIMPLVSHYQVITGLEFMETCQPLAQMLNKLNIDGVSQFEFAKLFIEGVVEENPTINTPEWREDIKTTLNKLVETELELVSTLTAGENDYFDISYISNHYVDEMLSILDAGYTRHKASGDYSRGYEFVQVITSLAPTINHEAGLGSFQW